MRQSAGRFKDVPNKPEPFPLEYAKPTYKPWIVRTTFFLGLFSGPLSLGFAMLVSLMTDSIPAAWATMVIPFLTVAILGAVAIRSTHDAGHRRRVKIGLAVAGIWFLVWIEFMTYASMNIAL